LIRSIATLCGETAILCTNKAIRGGFAWPDRLELAIRDAKTLDKNTLFRMQCDLGAVGTCERMLDNEADAFSRAAMLLAKPPNYSGETALIGACKQGNVSLVEILIRNSPNEQVLATNNHGMSALMRACGIQGGHANAACVNILLGYSPNEQVLATDNHGMSALMWACIHGHAACVKILLRHSPDTQVLATDHFGLSALMMACFHGHAACVKILLRHSPYTQVLATECHGRSALMYANASCVKILLRIPS
jgi:ankyrin repeat protein